MLAAFEYVPDRHPVHARRLPGDLPDAALPEPLPKLFQIPRERPEHPFFDLDVTTPETTPNTYAD